MLLCRGLMIVAGVFVVVVVIVVCCIVVSAFLFPSYRISMAPLVVPNNGDAKIHVHHHHHVAFLRQVLNLVNLCRSHCACMQDIARYLAYRHSNLDANAVFDEMNRLSKTHTGIASGQDASASTTTTAAAGTGGPAFQVKFGEAFLA